MQTFPSNPDLQQYGFKNVENYHIYVHCYPTHTFATIAICQNYQNYKPYTPCTHIEQYCQVQVITRSKISHSKSCISTMYVYFSDFRALFGQKFDALFTPFWTPFGLHILRHTLYFLYKMLAIRPMTWKYSNVISKLLIHEICIFLFKEKAFFPYVDL